MNENIEKKEQEDEEPNRKDVFLRARFAGGRFDSHSIPFEVLADLGTYRNLIIEVAKMLFKKRRNGRVRVPKGFEDSFQIGLVQIEGGQSAVAYGQRLATPEYVSAQQTMPFPPFTEFDEARVYVENLIRHVSNEGTVPPDFPTELAGRFNPFGQSLQDDEYVELSHAGSKPVRYDTFIRKKIVLSREKTYENNVDGLFILNGGVADTGTIHVRDEAGASLDFRPLTDSEFEMAFSRPRKMVRLIGTGLYDREERLRRLLDVASIIYEEEQQGRQPFEDRLDEIAATEAGWYEEDTPAPSPNAVDAMRNLVSIILQERIAPEPHLYPTPDGGVAAEWTYGDWEASANVDIEARNLNFHAININTRQEIHETLPSMDGALSDQFAKFWAILELGVGESNAARE